MTHFVVIGGGSWGAAIASGLQRAQKPVTILARNKQTVDMLAKGRCPKLVDCKSIAPIAATTDYNCLATAKMIFVAVPVQANAKSFDIINAMQLQQSLQMPGKQQVIRWPSGPVAIARMRGKADCVYKHRMVAQCQQDRAGNSIAYKTGRD